MKYRPELVAARFAICLLSLSIINGNGPFAAQENVFTPQHVAKLRMVTQGEISPDGSRVAYVLSVPRVPLKEDDGPAWAELHVVTNDGASRPYVTGQVNVSVVAWRPGGDEISFLAKRGKDEHASLHVIPVAGGEARKVSNHKSDITGYSWSPDGKRVAFLATEPLAKERKELKDKGFSQQIYEEDWQPVRVWVAATDDKDAKPRMLDLPGSAFDVRWGPAGGRLAVVLAPSPLVDDGMMNKKVHVVDAESGKVTARIDTPGKLGQIARSPDGKNIAMISAADRNDPHEGRLVVASADGGAPTEVVPNFDGHVSSIAWRDAETIAFVGDEGLVNSFGEVKHDGSGRKMHVPAVASVFASCSISRDGKTAAWLEQSSRHPAEVFAIRIGDKSARRLTDSNPWLAALKFALQEAVKFKARDGLELEGVLVKPLDAAPGKRNRLILAVHGGPESFVPNGWNTSYANPGQVAAARGFAVFYPNWSRSPARPTSRRRCTSCITSNTRGTTGTTSASAARSPTHDAVNGPTGESRANNCRLGGIGPGPT